MATPQVSIIIPAYNHGAYLGEAIDSVVEQTYPNVELIVVDDGSTDNTDQVLEKYSSGIIKLKQKNQGQSKALENGWNLASGEFIGYLSADDKLAPNAISRLMETLVGDPKVIVAYPDFALFDHASRPIRLVSAPEFDFHKMLTDINCPPGPGAVFRADAYAKTGPWNPDYKQMPDFDFWLRLALHGNFEKVPEPLAFFRVHENSQTFSAASPERANEPIIIIDRFFEQNNLPQGIAALQSKATAMAHLISAQLHWKASRRSDAMQCLSKIAGIYPKLFLTSKALRILFNATFNQFGHRVLWNIKNFVSSWRKS